MSERRLRVEAVFLGVEERHAQTIAAEMIDRAHELANLPDCQCDVDVNIEQTPAAGDGGDPVAPPPHMPSATR
jgi:hypothetical protein